MQQEDIKNTTTEETSANEQEVREEAAEETVAEETAESTEAKEEAVVDERDEKITELNNRLMRLQADFDNFRRRTAGEKEQLSGFVTAGVVGKFLKVLDNFERAEASAEKSADLEGLLTGMKQIRRQFAEAFKELGVEEIAAQDAKFDPNLHEAVMRGQNPELEDETIDMVFEKGYKLHDRVIRHSKVRVISNE